MNPKICIKIISLKVNACLANTLNCALVLMCACVDYKYESTNSIIEVMMCCFGFYHGQCSLFLKYAPHVHCSLRVYDLKLRWQVLIW